MDKGDTLAFEIETGPKLLRGQMIADFDKPSYTLKRRHAQERVANRFIPSEGRP